MNKCCVVLKHTQVEELDENYCRYTREQVVVAKVFQEESKAQKFAQRMNKSKKRRQSEYFYCVGGINYE